MAWGFLDWVRGRPRAEDPTELKLRANASPGELHQLALLLPSDPRAYDAYKLLSEQKERARPVLERLFQEDVRFRSIEGKIAGWSEPPLRVILNILVKWRSEFAIDELSSMVGADDWRLRAIAGRLLASTGEARFIPVLSRLAGDPNSEVRNEVGHGISDGVDYGDQYGRTFDDAVAIALYPFLRDCALRTSRGPAADFPKLMLRVDRTRAVADLASDSALTLERNWLRHILRSLRKAKVEIPRQRIESLFTQAIALLDEETYDRNESPVNRWLLTELLICMATHDIEAAREQVRALRWHRQAEARDAAQEARSRLLGNPSEIVWAAHEAAGKAGLDAMRHEHRVFELVFSLFGEVENGGWLQWVANSSGRYALETLAALREIGASSAADELQKVIDILGPAGRSSKQAERMAAIDKMMNAGRSLPPDSIIWEMSADLRALCFDYADRHLEAFPPTLAALDLDDEE